VVRSVVRLKDLDLPLGVYYFGSVVSSEGEAIHTGIELLGEKDLKGDRDVILAIHSLLKSLGVESVTVSVGHVGVVEGILSSLDEKEQVRKAFLEKDLTYLRRRFGSSPVADLPLMQGGKEVLGILDRMGFERVKEDLLRIGGMLSEAGVEFIYDLSEIRELPYYTGVVFEFFHPKIGSPIAGGGRYDRLSKVFGSDIPSTGGTVYVDRVVEVLRLRGAP